MDPRPISLVRPTAGAGSPLRPIDARGVRVTGGFWGERVGRNRAVTLLHGAAQLEASGALGNLRRAAEADGAPVGGYRGGLDDAGVTFPFLDSDVYKWLEAIGWELGRADSAELRAVADPVIAAIEQAQRPDGYLGTYVQLTGRTPFSDLEWGHELYCIGHLAQAAIALDRTVGDARLLQVVRRAIERIEREVGPGARNGIDGHPEIEMALVELYRHTGEERFLALARHQVEQRGRGYLGPGRFGPAYWQDVLPVREAPTVTGHAVRQVYLDCGVVDVAVETGDRALLDAAIARWEEMVARRTYLTGAIGSRHQGEAFGDAWELPPDRAYAETCAAIGSVMLAWRLLLATGEARFADHLERTLYNAVLPGLALDGVGFSYCDPLLVRSGGTGYGGRAVRGREPWYACACCPPNLMRTLAAFEHLVATADGAGVTVWLPAEASVAAPAGDGTARLAIRTGYPADGTIGIVVEAAPGGSWPLGVRIPAWAAGATASVGGTVVAAIPGTVLRVERDWQPGDVLEVTLPMVPRITHPDPRIDAVRGCAAIERGPLVLCLEAVDLPPGATIETVALEPGALPADNPDPAPGGLPAVRVAGRVLAPADGAWPYGSALGTPAATPATLRAIPYLAWANRRPGGMRVWVPLA
ncbi:MAG: glycoside hydrolase family 127 protein [Chloroflexota bacterium]